VVSVEEGVILAEEGEATVVEMVALVVPQEGDREMLMVGEEVPMVGEVHGEDIRTAVEGTLREAA
jgi:TPP-dependent indolepyruvate ferredoxin oxidoreductase alpha subunit